MAYYDKIAIKWHKYTGYKGGSFKELILNEKIISKVDEIKSKTILEIGIGNGYFMPLLMKNKSGQIPDKIFLTDLSLKNLEIAKKNFKVPNSVHRRLDLYKKFGFDDSSIDLIISNMVFNEVNSRGLRNGVDEIKRVLRHRGKFIISVLHPKFIKKQIERGAIKNNMMVSTNGLRIPTVERNLEEYIRLLDSRKFIYELEDVFGNKKLFNKKPKLKELEEIPIGLIIFGESNKEK